MVIERIIIEIRDERSANGVCARCGGLPGERENLEDEIRSCEREIKLMADKLTQLQRRSDVLIARERAASEGASDAGCTN